MISCEEKTVQAETHPENTAARKVLEKNGL